MISNSPPVFPRRAFSFAKASPVYGFSSANFPFLKCLIPSRFARTSWSPRIHVIVRRSKDHAQSVVQTGDLVVNLDTKTVEVNGARGHPTPAQGHEPPLWLHGRAQAQAHGCVFICKLRKKLANASDGKDYIETVWGRG